MRTNNYNQCFKLMVDDLRQVCAKNKDDMMSLLCTPACLDGIGLFAFNVAYHSKYKIHIPDKM